MALHQRAVFGFGKGATGHDHIRILQGQAVRLIHQPQQVVMLRLRGELLKMHAADGQKHPLRRTGQRLNCGCDIRHAVPLVAGLRAPGRAGQRDQRRLGPATGRNRIAAHLRGKGVGCVDHMADPVVADVGNQPLHAAKSTNPHRQGLRTRGLYPARIGIHRRNPLRGNGFGQRIGLGRAAEDQEVGHA